MKMYNFDGLSSTLSLVHKDVPEIKFAVYQAIRLPATKQKRVYFLHCLVFLTAFRTSFEYPSHSLNSRRSYKRTQKVSGLNYTRA